MVAIYLCMCKPQKPQSSNLENERSVEDYSSEMIVEYALKP